MERRKGFTLVELVVFITLVGILLSIIVPRYDGIKMAIQESMDLKSCESMAVQLRLKAKYDNLKSTDGFSRPLTKEILGEEVYNPVSSNFLKFWYYYGPKRLTGEWVVLVYMNKASSESRLGRSHSYSEIVDNEDLMYIEMDVKK